LAAAGTLAACSPFTEACTSELRVELMPRDTTVAVGEVFPLGAKLGTCGGKKEIHDALTFHSSNPAVVAVDGATGRASPMGSGTAEIAVSGQQYGRLGSIRVTVQP